MTIARGLERMEQRAAQTMAGEDVEPVEREGKLEEQQSNKDGNGGNVVAANWGPQGWGK